MTRCRPLALPIVLSLWAALVVGTVPAVEGAPAAPETGAVAERPKPKPRKPKPAPAPRIAPARAVAGETVQVTGRLKVERRTKVALERKKGARWVSVKSTRAAKNGQYRFRLPAPATRTVYRATARKGEVRSRTRALQVLPQSGSLTVPASTAATGAAVATFAPARPGRTVTLQQLVQGSWRDVASAVQSGAGAASLPVPLDLEESATYRAVAATWRGAAAVETGTAVVGVQPTGARIVAPVAGAVVSGTVPVRVDPAGAGVTRVAVFAGGTHLANATAQPDGSWLAQLDTAELANGRNDVAARVWTSRRSRLLPSVRVTVRNDSASTSTNVEEGFRIDTLVGGLSLPTSFAVLDERRTLITEKDGLVRMVVDGDLRPTPVLDLTDAVTNYWDQGLIGIALDPDFADNGWFYLAYVVRREGAQSSDPGSQTVVRYTLTGEVAQPSSAHVVLGRVHGAACSAAPSTPDCLPVRGSSHTIGDLLFLPDGSLLVSLGDGNANTADRTGSLRSQDLSVLAGKILRVDPVEGKGYPDNPFYDPTEPNASRVWAYGFRNPFRMALSPEGKVYVADVGEMTWEEVNRVEPGGNYGWPCLEGTKENPLGVSGCDPILDGDPETTPTVGPVHMYHHFYDLGSASGGVFYTGENYPAAYQGRYFFGDYSWFQIWNLDMAAAEEAAAAGDPDEPGPRSYFASRPTPGAPVKFGMGADGNIWYLSVTTGELRSIVYDPDGTGCPSDRFVGSYYDAPVPAASAEPMLETCTTALPEDGLEPPYDVADNGYSVRWSGRPAMAPGTYRAQLAAEGTVEVSVEGVPVEDGQTFVLAPTGSTDPRPLIEVRHSRTELTDDDLSIAFEQLGSPPTVVIGGLQTGERLAPGTSRSWTVSATGPGGPIASADVNTTVGLLHYGTGGHPHLHPSGTFTGPGGSFTFDQDHAPGGTVFRIDASAVGSDGSVGLADPVYVCLTGNEVGPCGQ